MSDCSTYVDFMKYTSTKMALNKNLPNLNICKNRNTNISL